MFILFFALGAICLIYYIALVSYSGTATPFSEAWIMATVVCLLLGLCFVIPHTKMLINKIPKVVKICVISIVGAGALLFLVLLINVITGFNDKPQEKVDVVVVLGAKMRGNTVSRALADRLDAAYDYVMEEGNEDVVIIVSGGQGADEIMTEAQGMKDYLIDKGLDGNRIIMEDKSTNTMENLKFSYEIIEEMFGNNASIAICTSNFHVYRATLLAENMGIENVSGLAAYTKPILLPNSTVRECLALVKEWMIGNIKLW